MADDQENELVITIDDSSSSSSSSSISSVAKEAASVNEAVAADESLVESAEGKEASLRLLAMLTGAASIVDAGEQQLKKEGKKRGKYKKREFKKKDKVRAANYMVPMMEPCNDVSTVIERPTFAWSKPETTVHYIIPTVIEEYVSRAVSMITGELLSGMWWTSHHPNELDEDSNVLPRHSLPKSAPDDSSLPPPPVAHWMRFSQALHQFSKEVIVPSLIAHHVQDNQGRRAFLATCMMLREILITNAEGVFYPSETTRAEFESDNSSRSRQMEAKEEQFFSNSIVVTVMIFTALQKLDDAAELTNAVEPSILLCPPRILNDIMSSDEVAPTHIAHDSNNSATESHSVPQILSTEAKKNNASLCEDFASLLSDYHTLSGPFAAPLSATTAPYWNVDTRSPSGPNSPDADGDVTLPSLKRELPECLPRVDFRHVGVLPNGKSLGEQENLAWRVSYNIVRDRHFLSNTRVSQNGYTKNILMSSKRRKSSCAIQRLIPPVANIAAIYMVERIDEHQQRPSAAERQVDNC